MVFSTTKILPRNYWFDEGRCCSASQARPGRIIADFFRSKEVFNTVFDIIYDRIETKFSDYSLMVATLGELLSTSARVRYYYR